MADESVRRPFILRWRSAVLNSKLAASQKLTLLVLADFADKDGARCIPSVELLAEQSSQGEATCRRALNATTNTWFTRTPIKFEGRVWRGYSYRLQIPEGAVTVTGCRREVAIRATGPIDPSSGQFVSEVRSLSPKGAVTVTDDLGRATRKSNKEELCQQERAPADLFDKFWNCYPRKVAKPKAEAAWKSKRLEPLAEKILADVAARAADPGQWQGTPEKFIPHPTTYLNQRRWEDEWQRSTRQSATTNLLPRETNAEAINAASMRRMGLEP